MKISVITIPPAAIERGTPLGGGFFACNYLHVDRPAQLIIAPKLEGEFTLTYKDEWSTSPGAQSVIDGLANSEAMNDKHHPAAWWCRQLRIGGHDDWCLPARDQLDMLYRAFKPTGDANFTYANRMKRWSAKKDEYNGVDKNGNGHNAYLGAGSAAYTDKSPGQTTADLFKAGGSEAFDRRWYLSSTEFGSDGAWAQAFVDGGQDYWRKHNALAVRAVRTLFLND